jgi:hypothetical protein
VLAFDNTATKRDDFTFEMTIESFLPKFESAQASWLGEIQQGFLAV